MFILGTSEGKEKKYLKKKMAKNFEKKMFDIFYII